MKFNFKNFYKIVSAVLFSGFVLVPVLANASALTTTPVSVTVGAGQTFTIQVYMDGQSKNAYTAKMELKFPASLVSVSKWEFAPDVTALRQPEYDTMDNNLGLLVRTAGFAGGFSDRKLFGRATFVSRAKGTATISVSGNSFILDDANKDTLSTRGQSVINITEASKTAPTPVVIPEAVDITFNTELKESDVIVGNPIIVLTNLAVSKQQKNPINTTVNYAVYDSLGQTVTTKNVELSLLTESATAQKIDLGNLAPGSYFLSTEVTYVGQKEPQKVQALFNVVPPVPVIVEKNIYPWQLLALIAALLAIIIIGLVYGYYQMSKHKKRAK